MRKSILKTIVGLICICFLFSGCDKLNGKKETSEEKEVTQDTVTQTDTEEGSEKESMESKTVATTLENRPDTIEADVTQVPDGIEVPDVVDKKVDMAQQTLENKGFLVDIKEEYNDEIEKDRIIRQMPEPSNGLLLKSGETITLVKSLGKDTTVSWMDEMSYADVKTESVDNNFAVVSGKEVDGIIYDHVIAYNLRCNENLYSGEVKAATDKAEYQVYYNIGKKYSRFTCQLKLRSVDGRINPLEIKFMSNDQVLYQTAMSSEVTMIDIDLDIADCDAFSIYLGTPFASYNYGYSLYCLNPKFE